MNIRECSRNLQKLYEEMSQAFGSLQEASKLPCPSQCGQCCLNPDIEASPMEMLPMALKILEAGKLEEWLEKLEGQSGSPCVMFNGRGCSSYEERPSVCRMFGVAGYYHKDKRPTLSICKLLRERFPEEVRLAQAQVNEETPVMANWTARLVALDPKHIERRLPINEALQRALQKVALWAQYQE